MKFTNHAVMLAILILMGYITFAMPLEEFSFAEQGYSDFYINGAGSFDCVKYEFIYTGDLNAGIYPFFSLEADFTPKQGENAQVTVYFNDDNKTAELSPKDFTDGIARIPLEREKLAENNNLRVCGKTSYSINKIKISAQSKFGTYFAPEIREDEFTLRLETYRPIVGKEFKIIAVARNYGSEDTEISISYRRENLEENLEEISILKGETSSKGVLPGCAERNAEGECVIPGEYTIEYTATANKAVPMTLLPAILAYKDAFGEERAIESNRPSFEAVEPENAISAQAFLEKDNPKAGEEITVKIKVLNSGAAHARGIIVRLITGLEAVGESEKTIESIGPGETKELIFTVKGISQGEYSLGCEAIHSEKTAFCTGANIKVESTGIGAEILAGIGFILIAAAVFLYYHFKP